jgi:hypothetical protein
MLPAKFGSIWPSSFRGEDFFNSSQSDARSSIKHLHLVPFVQQIWLPRAILFSDWLLLKKSSPLKLLGQMEPNLAGSIYVRSSIKFLRFVLFCPLANQKKELLLVAIFVGQMEPNEDA